MVASGSARVNLNAASKGSGTARRERDSPTVSLVELAERPLFEPLRDLLIAVPDTGPCGLDALNVLFSRHAPRFTSAVRFVPPDAMPMTYEERIVARAEVVTRPGSWHDFFNALVWTRFPRTKHGLAVLHAEGMRSPAGDGRRGPVRDAATQFDESGVVVAASAPSLLALLERRRWKELFWQRRIDVCSRMRFLVFGHGLYDALRAPFYRICGRAATVVVASDWIAAPVAALCAYVDPILAQRFARRTCYPRPKSLLALPLLGIPGVCADNEEPGYYDDVVQFRPLPPA